MFLTSVTGRTYFSPNAVLLNLTNQFWSPELTKSKTKICEMLDRKLYL